MMGGIEINYSASKSSIHGYALKALSQATRPLSVQEITKKVREHRRIYSAHPNNTVSSILQKSSFVRRNDFGFYSLIRKPVYR